MRDNPDLGAAFAAPVEQLAAAAAQLRPNQILDGVFGAMPAPPALGPAFTAADPTGGRATMRPRAAPPDPLGAVLPAALAAPPVAARTPGPVLGPAFTAADPTGGRATMTPLGAQPTSGAPPGTQPPAPGGVNPADVPRFVREIRDGVVKLVAQAARGGGTGQPPGSGAPPAPGGGYGLGDALRPLANGLRNSRLGQVGERFAGRLRPALRAASRGAGGRKGGVAPE